MSEEARCEPEVQQSWQKTVVAHTELWTASCPLHSNWFLCPCTTGCCVAVGGRAAAAALHAASLPTVGQIPAELSSFPTSSLKQQPRGHLWRQLQAWDLCIAVLITLYSPYVTITQLSIWSSVIAVRAQACWALYTSDPSWVLQSQWELQVWGLCFSASLLLGTSEDTGQLQPHQRRGVEVNYTNLCNFKKT